MKGRANCVSIWTQQPRKIPVPELPQGTKGLRLSPPLTPATLPLRPFPTTVLDVTGVDLGSFYPSPPAPPARPSAPTTPPSPPPSPPSPRPPRPPPAPGLPPGIFGNLLPTRPPRPPSFPPPLAPAVHVDEPTRPAVSRPVSNQEGDTQGIMPGPDEQGNSNGGASSRKANLTMWQAGVLAGCVLGGVALATVVAGAVLWRRCGPDNGAGKGKAAAYAVAGPAAGSAGGSGGASGGGSDDGSAVGAGIGTAVVAATAAAAGGASAGYAAVTADLPPLSEPRSSASGYQVGRAVRFRAVLCRTVPCCSELCGYPEWAWRTGFGGLSVVEGGPGAALAS